MKKVLFLLVLGLFLSTSSFALAHAGEDHITDTSTASDQIAEISVNAAEKIMKESIDAAKNKEIVNRYLSEINKN